nr:MAG TPA: hypothetical protein [Caudoviricetes sp.]
MVDYADVLRKLIEIYAEQENVDVNIAIERR